MKRIFLLLITALACVIAGCGGGGGGGTATPTPTGATIRHLQAGDNLVYALTGAIDTGTEQVPVSGTLTITTHSSTATSNYGERSLDQVVEVNVIFNGHSIVQNHTSYIEQAADGTIYYLGYEDSSGDHSYISMQSGEPVNYKSPVVAGSNYNYAAIARGDYAWTTETEQCTALVRGMEAVNNQMAYKIHFTNTNSDGSSTGDEWFVPDWGYFIKGTLTLSTADGTLTGTAVLQSKNF